MNKARIPILGEVLKTYYTEKELLELAAAFNIFFPPDEITALGFARRLIEEVDFANYPLLTETVLEQAEIRNAKALTNTYSPDWHVHAGLSSILSELKRELSESSIPSEIVVAEGKPFLAKSEVRDFLAAAKTEVFIVDRFVGVGTLDCLRDLTTPIRLLAGTHKDSIEEGFDRALQSFCAEGLRIHMRQHPILHDRHLIFNERCWLVGSSLKDAGKKAFHVIEIVDTRTAVLTALEAKWSEATPYPAL